METMHPIHATDEAPTTSEGDAMSDPMDIPLRFFRGNVYRVREEGHQSLAEDDKSWFHFAEGKDQNEALETAQISYRQGWKSPTVGREVRISWNPIRGPYSWKDAQTFIGKYAKEFTAEDCAAVRVKDKTRDGWLFFGWGGPEPPARRRGYQRVAFSSSEDRVPRPLVADELRELREENERLRDEIGDTIAELQKFREKREDWLGAMAEALEDAEYQAATEETKKARKRAQQSQKIIAGLVGYAFFDEEEEIRNRARRIALERLYAHIRKVEEPMGYQECVERGNAIGQE